MQLCCRAFQARHVIGHLHQQTISAIFDNPHFQLARRVICDGLWTPPDGPIPCTGCNRLKLHLPEINRLAHGLGLADP